MTSLDLLGAGDLADLVSVAEAVDAPEDLTVARVAVEQMRRHRGA